MVAAFGRHLIMSRDFIDWPLNLGQYLRTACSDWIHSNAKPHYTDVIMSLIASHITSLTIVYSIVYSDADQRKHQSSALQAFVWGVHRGPVNSLHKWPVTQKMFPFDDVIMVRKEKSIWMDASLECAHYQRNQINYKEKYMEREWPIRGQSVLHDIYCLTCRQVGRDLGVQCEQCQQMLDEIVYIKIKL